MGLWLVGYVTKQVLFGRERFGGSPQQYWQWYVPVLSLHTVLASVTIGLGAYNLYIGLTRLRQGIGVGAMVAGVSRHRLLGRRPPRDSSRLSSGWMGFVGLGSLYATMNDE